MFHEGKACDAVVRFLERREDTSRERLILPDNARDDDPVDVAFCLDGRIFAMEHTGIEPFERQITLNEITGEFLAPIDSALEKIVPEGECYALGVPPNAADGIRRRDVSAIQQRVISWVSEAAPQRNLLAANRMDTQYGLVSVPGVPFPLLLTRRKSISRTIRRFQLGYLHDGDEDARLTRIRKGYDKKLGKLLDWKAKARARTILVFVNIDLQLTNHIVVTQAVLKVVGDGAPRPDEIYLVDAAYDKWQVVPLLVDSISALELGADWHWDIDPGQLENLTGR